MVNQQYDGYDGAEKEEWVGTLVDREEPVKETVMAAVRARARHMVLCTVSYGTMMASRGGSETETPRAPRVLLTQHNLNDAFLLTKR